MKYKRKLIGSMFALTLLASNPSAVDMEDFLPNSKVEQYINQVQMKSSKDENKVDMQQHRATQKSARRHKN